MVPRRQLKLPSINLVAMAIHMFVLMPNRALNTALQYPPKPVSYQKKTGDTTVKHTYIVIVPRRIMGFRPYLSDITPHRTDVSARPSMNAQA